MFKRKIKWHKILDSKEELNDRLANNRALLLRLDDKKICLARNTKGYYAVGDKCPHQGASMSKGVCSDEGYIECPWHKYRFDLQTGRDRAGLGDALRVYPMRIDGKGVFIGVEYTAFTLFDWLGDD